MTQILTDEMTIVDVPEEPTTEPVVEPQGEQAPPEESPTIPEETPVMPADAF